jgi:hypothetical protein
MATADETSETIESDASNNGMTRSLTDRWSKGPIIAAGRLMSCLSKPSRQNTTKRHYTVVIDHSEKSSISHSLFKPISSIRHRSTSPYSLSTSSLHSVVYNSSSTMRNSTTIPLNLSHVSTRTSTTSTPMPDTIGHDVNFDSTYSQLRELAETNCLYFSQQKTDVCQRFERLLNHLLQSIDHSLPLIRCLIENFHHFDYSPQVSNY